MLYVIPLIFIIIMIRDNRSHINKKDICLMLGLILFMVHVKCYNSKGSKENFINIPNIKGSPKWIRNKCPFMMNKTISAVLKDNDIERDDNDHNMMFPCSYDRIQNEMEILNEKKKKNHKNQRIFIIDNADQLAAKNNIWINVVKKYGRQAATDYLPYTYILDNSYDIELLEKEYNEDDVYILKNNIQQQKGLKMTKDLDDIMKSNKYILVQKMLQDPYLINERKINMRVYVLLVCQGGDIACYAHRDGFMYYTNKPFRKGSINFEEVITSGYIDREVYDISPLTLENFRKYLNDNKRKKTLNEQKISGKYKLSDYVFRNIYKMLSKVLISIMPNICNNDDFKQCVTYQLFGADVALDDRLEAKLMEFNKGPDMKPKDDRDKEVKYKVMSDVFDIVKIKKSKNNRFVKLNETDNNKIIEYIR